MSLSTDWSSRRLSELAAQILPSSLSQSASVHDFFVTLSIAISSYMLCRYTYRVKDKSIAVLVAIIAAIYSVLRQNDPVRHVLALAFCTLVFGLGFIVLATKERLSVFNLLPGMMSFLAVDIPGFKVINLFIIGLSLSVYAIYIYIFRPVLHFLFRYTLYALEIFHPLFLDDKLINFFRKSLSVDNDNEISFTSVLDSPDIIVKIESSKKLVIIFITSLICIMIHWVEIYSLQNWRENSNEDVTNYHLSGAISISYNIFTAFIINNGTFEDLILTIFRSLVVHFFYLYMETALSKKKNISEFYITFLCGLLTGILFKNDVNPNYYTSIATELLFLNTGVITKFNKYLMTATRKKTSRREYCQSFIETLFGFLEGLFFASNLHQHFYFSCKLEIVIVIISWIFGLYLIYGKSLVSAGQKGQKSK